MKTPNQIIPFNLTDTAKKLAANFPDPKLLLEIAAHFGQEELDSFIRLWITEGFPYVFRNKPMLYEASRSWLGNKLKVDPQNIFLAGSARAGYSLKPLADKYGHPFTENSDLDFALISTDYFNKLVKAFYAWKRDYENDKISPKNNQEKKYWLANINNLPINIKHGFIDHYKIPFHKEYSPASTIEDTLWMLREKIHSTPDCPTTQKVSLRVFKDWPSYLRRTSINIKELKKIATTPMR